MWQTIRSIWMKDSVLLNFCTDFYFTFPLSNWWTFKAKVSVIFVNLTSISRIWIWIWMLLDVTNNFIIIKSNSNIFNKKFWIHKLVSNLGKKYAWHYLKNLVFGEVEHGTVTKDYATRYCVQYFDASKSLCYCKIN